MQNENFRQNTEVVLCLKERISNIEREKVFKWNPLMLQSHIKS